jgi:hypothetical protein
LTLCMTTTTTKATERKTYTVTLSNDFHGRECTVRVLATKEPTAWEAWTSLSPAQERRVRRLLCGADKGQCTCGVVRMHA